nr:hypothetical protein [Tanacetum cinerariifolium]
MCRGGGSGGDGNAAGAVHLARRSPAEGVDSESDGNPSSSGSSVWGGGAMTGSAPS